jgi:hypothetical protein
MNEPKYHYAPHAHGFAIYEKESEGSYKKIDYKIDREEAKKEVYRLNGWEYKPKNNK